MKRAALILAGFLCGCDVLGPDPVSVKLSLLQEGAPIIDRRELFTNIECVIRMTVSATGHTNEWVRLGKMRLSFFTGPDQSAPTAQITVAADAVRQTFRQDSVVAGKPTASPWTMFATFPFAVQAVVEFETAAGRRDETPAQRLACGPDVRGVKTPIPVVTGRFIPDPTLPTTDRLIEYTATSALGLWETVFEVSSRTQKALVSFEDQAKTVTRQVRVPFGLVPPGTPVRISVTSFDVAMQRSQTFELIVER